MEGLRDHHPAEPPKPEEELGAAEEAPPEEAPEAELAVAVGAGRSSPML